MSNFARRLNGAVRFKGKQDRGIKSYSKYSSGGGSSGDAKLDERHLKVVALKLAAFPEALDMLVFVLRTIVEKRKESKHVDPKYTELKANTQRFQRSIGKSGEWGEELLKIAGFYRSGDWFRLRTVDSARLWLVKSFLEEEKKSDQYRVAKRKVEFQKALERDFKESSSAELAKRKELALKVPPPPPEGAGGSTRVWVLLGATVVQRFFNYDDMLSEVIMWMASTYSSTIQDRIVDGSYELVNKSLFPGTVLDYSKDMGRTLADLGLSPNGELHIMPKGLFVEEKEMNGGGIE